MNNTQAGSAMALQGNLSRRVNVGDMLTRSAARAPHRIALVEGSRRLDYRAFNEAVNRCAHGLLGLGYRPGDVLGLMAGNCIEFLVAYYACAKTGVVCTPVNLFWRQGELSYVLGHAGVRGLMVQQRWLAELAGALPELPAVREVIVIAGPEHVEVELPGRIRSLTLAQITADQPAAEPEVLVDDRAALSYLYSSGTTSAPKGVIGNHLAIYLGWFHSGDVGHFDADGMLWFEDRHKDVIESGGENIASIEVEKALYAVEPKLAEVVVVGLPHERWGEAVTAVVTLRPGASIDTGSVLARLKTRLSPFKCPKAIIVRDALPRTATGKIRKTEVRKAHADFFRAPAEKA